MNTILTLALVIVALAVLPVALVSTQCLLALIPGRPRYNNEPAPRPTVAVLVPAHNEETMIRQTIDTITPHLRPGDRLLVIADNCTDQTAAVATSAGAEVIERHDPTRRGKGYALAHGVAALQAAPPERVVIADADCLLAPGAIGELIRSAVSSRRPAQSLYLMDLPTNPGPRDRVSAFAFLVKNMVRPLGCRRLGFPCLLQGTGMAFPWDVIRNAPLATGNIVEDMQLGIDLTFAGHAPIFCPEARVTGRLPADARTAATQRRRWEHGHLRTITHTVLPTLWRAFRHGRLDLLLLALDIAIPPLSLLVLLWTLLGGALFAFSLATGAQLPLVIWAAGTVLLIGSVFGAWYRFGRQIISIGTLASIPLYILAKIPLYISYLISPQRDWIRTDRGRLPNPATQLAPATSPPK